MPQKIKEEERIERIIRGLLKLPENRRCINCNSLGPQYVCTTFWTFVCTNCSGVHREFTHRVKSVSMAKFSAEEVTALQAGGNERARQIYFKSWDPQRNSFPDGSNLHRLRDFIKHVYLDRKYAGAKNNDKLSMIKAGARDDYQQRPSFEASSYGAREDFFESRSFRGTDHALKDDFFERHSFENSIPRRRNDGRNFCYYNAEKNSPRYRQEKLRSGSLTTRTTRFEVVDDRFREDGCGNVRRSEHLRHSNEESRARSSSPISQKIGDNTSHAAVRPLKDILGDKSSSLKVGESPKANKIDGSAQVQMAGSSNDSSANKKEQETKTMSSLIDFDDDPETSATTAVVQTQQTAPAGDGGNISAPSSGTQNVSSNPNDNSLESLLFGLAGPGGDTPSVATSGSFNTDIGTDASRMENANAVPSNNGEVQSKGANQQQSRTMKQILPSAVPVENSSSTAQQATTFEALHNQSLNSESAYVNRPQTNASSGQSLQVASKAAQGTTVVNESIPSGRQELPADLFTSSYESFSTSVPAWQSRPPYGMGYSTQYHPTSMSLGTPLDPAKSRNPFHIGDNDPQLQDTMFPSMSSVQGALPNMSPSPGLLSQSQASPYVSPIPPQGPYGMMTPPGAYMGLQPPNNIHPSRPQGVNSFGSNDSAFASLNPIHHQSSGGGHPDTAFRSLNPVQKPSGLNPSSVAPNSYSSTGGNPFG